MVSGLGADHKMKSGREVPRIARDFGNSEDSRARNSEDREDLADR